MCSIRVLRVPVEMELHGATLPIVIPFKPEDDNELTLLDYFLYRSPEMHEIITSFARKDEVLEFANNRRRWSQKSFSLNEKVKAFVDSYDAGWSSIFNGKLKLAENQSQPVPPSYPETTSNEQDPVPSSSTNATSIPVGDFYPFCDITNKEGVRSETGGKHKPSYSEVVTGHNSSAMSSSPYHSPEHIFKQPRCPAPRPRKIILNHDRDDVSSVLSQATNYAPEETEIAEEIKLTFVDRASAKDCMWFAELKEEIMEKGDGRRWRELLKTYPILANMLQDFLDLNNTK